MFKSLLHFTIVLILFVSCATERPTGKTEAEVLFKEAKELVENSRYLLATERLNTLRSQYPYSYFATHAELMQADILFSQENFVESAAAYVLFKDFHPRHKKLDYVVYKIAESFYMQIPATFDRDLSPAFEAIKYYEELLNVYRRSDYIKGAMTKIKLAGKMIEDKERYIADFYFKTEIFKSAKRRYIRIIDTFKVSKPVVGHSMVRVIQAASLLNEAEECRKYYQMYKEKISKSFRIPLDIAYQACLGQKS